MDLLAQRFSSRRCPIMMQVQRSAKKTVSAMTVLVSRNDDDEEEESRTGMVSSTAIFGILLMILTFTIWRFWIVGYKLGLKIKLL